LNKKQLYALVFGLSLAGYVWIGSIIYMDWINYQNLKINLCIFTNLTGLPCPSCGMSRSVISVFQARFVDALWWNPLGFIMALAMLVFPVWIIYDLIANKQGFFRFYHSIEVLSRNKIIASLFILLILSLWIWNIMKFS
jgi:hypothetical protein